MGTRGLALLLAALLAGCALQRPPDPVELRRQALPRVEVPEHWASDAAGGTSVRDGWLASFNDPQLVQLVEEALAYNTDLQAAGARVTEAAGYARLSAASLYPAVNLLARGGGKLSGDNSGLEGVGLIASWELDVWGRVRYGRAAAEAQYASTLADLEYARQSLAATVARSWMLAIEARLQRAIAEDAIRVSERLLSLAKDRHRVGRGDAIDVANAEANVENYRDTARQLDLAFRQSTRALELLVGRYPGAQLAVADALPAMPATVPVGLPSDLLERRPDVIAAERRVAAAFHRTGEAKAARLPRISLTAGVNTISSDLFLLQDRDNPVWSAGASLMAPLYQGGALKSQVEIRSAEQRRAIADYAGRALRAFNDVENAMSAEFAAHEREQILMRSVAAWERAANLSRIAYEVGSIDLRPVQQQQLGVNGTRSVLLRVQSEQRVQRVNLHLALGGGFGGPETNLRDRVAVRGDADGTIVDIHRVVGSGATEVNVPAGGWPTGIKLRLHAFVGLDRVRVATSAATVECRPSTSFLDTSGFECASAGRKAGDPTRRDDYLELALPPTLTSAPGTAIALTWSEAAAPRRR
jgi:NodT family efflux transporter outer membrane factor (OMF) lipoprotein